MDNAIVKLNPPFSDEERERIISAHTFNGYYEEQRKNYSKSYDHYQKIISLIEDNCKSDKYWNCYGDKFYLGKYILYNLGSILLDIGAFEAILLELPDSFISEFKKVYDKREGKDLANFYILKGLATYNLKMYRESLGYFRKGIKCS